jgi:hypothetical protein
MGLEMIFFPIFSVIFNIQVCATNPADPASALAALKPGACAIRKEEYKFNR